METEARWHLYTTLGLCARPLQDIHHPPLGLGVYSRRAHCSVEHGKYHQGGRGATPVKICPEALRENGIVSASRAQAQAPGTSRRWNRVSGCGGVGVWKHWRRQAGGSSQREGAWVYAELLDLLDLLQYHYTHCTASITYCRQHARTEESSGS